MKDNRAYWIVGIIILVWYYLQKLQAANALMVRYMLPQNIRISKGAVMFNQPVVITNPTGTPIILQRYNMQVQVEGYPIGTAYGTIQTNLQAGGDTTILANVIIPLDALISTVPGLLNAGKSIDVRFVGNIVAELITVPIDTRISLPLPKILQ